MGFEKCRERAVSRGELLPWRGMAWRASAVPPEIEQDFHLMRAGCRRRVGGIGFREDRGKCLERGFRLAERQLEAGHGEAGLGAVGRCRIRQQRRRKSDRLGEAILPGQRLAFPERGFRIFRDERLAEQLQRFRRISRRGSSDSARRMATLDFASGGERGVRKALAEMQCRDFPQVRRRAPHHPCRMSAAASCPGRAGCGASRMRGKAATTSSDGRS